MRHSVRSIGLVSAALLGVALTTIPAVGGDCNIEKVVKEWTGRKTALSEIRKSLVKLSKAMQDVSAGGDPDYADNQFGGRAPKDGFNKAIAARQADFSIAILQFAGNCTVTPGSGVPQCTPQKPPTTCYACIIKEAYPLAVAAGAECTALIQKVQARPGFGGQTFNCEKVKDVSRSDLSNRQLGADYWKDVRSIQGPGGGLDLEGALAQPITSSSDEIVKFLLRTLEIKLKVYADIHTGPDPDPTGLANDINSTPCTGYAEYIAGTEPW